MIVKCLDVDDVPEGAGKTTLMTALAGKASYGVVTGSITINGRYAQKATGHFTEEGRGPDSIAALSA